MTPLGIGTEALWTGLVEGRCGIGPLRAFDSTPYGTRIAGEIPDFEPRDFLRQREITGSARVVQLMLAAARLALDDARLDPALRDPERTGIFVGTSVGTFQYAEENHAIFLEKGIRRVHPLFPAQAYPGVVATQPAISLKVRGPAIAVSTACTSAADAIGLALLHLQAGRVDRAIVGGSEAPLTPMLFGSFDRLGTMSRGNEHPERACRPFAAGRDGFVLSEGAAALVLETREAAEARGAVPRAELLGYAASSDAHHPLVPEPQGADAIRCVTDCLAASGLGAEDVDYVSAHAIGSVPSDPVELTVLGAVLGPRARSVPASSPKAQLGHTMGAAAALEAAICVRALETQTIPPSRNLDLQDLADAPVDLVADVPRPADLDHVLSTTFGFGSRNAALTFRRAPG